MTHTLNSKSAFFCGLSQFAPGNLSRTAKLRLAATLSALALAVTGLAPVRADASLHDGAKGLIVTSLAPAPAGGFWVQYDNPELFEDDPFDARTIPLEGAPDLGSASLRGSIAAIPGRNAYYIVTPQGRVYARGDTPEKVDPVLGWSHLNHHSSFPRIPIASQFIVAAAAHPSGQGLWAVGRDGKVWTWGTGMEVYGDVQFDSAEPAAIVPTPTGKGYYIAMDDGAVHARGDAVFYGSTGGNPPGGHQITGMALSIGDNRIVNGYWLVASDGGVHTFGGAPFWGSTGGNNGGFPVTNMVSFPQPVWGQFAQRTRGYAWVNTAGVVTALYGAYPDGTLVKGSSDDVYVVLNDYRFWIPNETTFNALGYQWHNIESLPDADLIAIPQRGQFPAVAPQAGPLKYPNGTLLKGSRDEIYVVLNDYRHWIPDPETFDALGYEWNNVQTLTDWQLNDVPVGAFLPSATGLGHLPPWYQP